MVPVIIDPVLVLTKTQQHLITAYVKGDSHRKGLICGNLFQLICICDLAVGSLFSDESRIISFVSINRNGRK